jgi:N-methylhydantoinase A/oxoprolinase/acetone carboxylase beta subunit
MRYCGQGHDVQVALPSDPVDDLYENKMRLAFHDTYRREYGFMDPDAAVEATDWHLVASLTNARSGVINADGAEDAAGSPVVSERQAYFPECGGMIPSKVINRYSMKPADIFEGPCLVEERECTTVVLPGDVVGVNELGHLVIEIDRASRHVQ